MTLSRRARVAAVLAASLLAHARGLTSPPRDYHYHRQVNTAAIARNYHRNGLEFLKPQIDWRGGYRGRTATEFPLYMWLTGLLWPLGGLGDLWGRLLSVLFSALTALYLLFWISEEVSPEAGLYAGVFFSFLPLEMYFGRTIQPEALALLCTTASLYHWDRHLRARADRAHWLAATACAFLAIAHKLPYAYALLPLAALAWLRRGPAALKDPGVWLAPAASGLGVWAWYRYAGSSGAYVVPAHAGEFLAMLQYRELGHYLWFQFLSRFPELAATYAGLVLMALGFRELVLRRGKVFFAVWWAAVALHLAAGGGYSFHHEYTSLPFAPVNAVFLGAGLAWLRARADALKGAARRRGLALAALLALAVPVHAYLRVGHWYEVNFPYLAQAGRAADAVSAPDELFICNHRAESLYLYYLDRKGWSWKLPEYGEGSFARIEDLASQGARFFMTAKDESFPEPYSGWFYARFPVVYDRDGILIFRLRS